MKRYVHGFPFTDGPIKIICRCDISRKIIKEIFCEKLFLLILDLYSENNYLYITSKYVIVWNKLTRTNECLINLGRRHELCLCRDISCPAQTQRMCSPAQTDEI